MRALDPVEQVEPAHALHANVAEDRVEAGSLDDLERLLRVRGELAEVALGLEEEAERVEHLGVVVHDQDASLGLGVRSHRGAS